MPENHSREPVPGTRTFIAVVVMAKGGTLVLERVDDVPGPYWLITGQRAERTPVYQVWATEEEARRALEFYEREDRHV